MEKYPKPKTISELLEFCSYHNMPLRQMRFFIGEDYPEPKAFGIFQAADGDFIVYKNKEDGSRAVRYKGPDEALAVNEIYEKLKSEVELRKNMKGQTGYDTSRSVGGESAEKKSLLSWSNILILTMIVLFAVICFRACKSPDRGYYRNNDTYYYYDSDDWYYYNNGWIILEDADWLNDNYSDYYLSDDYQSDYTAGDFRQSDYYDGYYERSYDYDDDDDDYDWGGNNDYGGWDIGDTNWNTDW